MIGADNSDIAVAFGDSGGDAASHDDAVTAMDVSTAAAAALSDDNNIAEDLGEAGSADGVVVDTAPSVGSAEIDQKPDLNACDDANVVGDAADAASVRTGSASESCGDDGENVIVCSASDGGDDGDNVIVCNASGTGGEAIATGNANDDSIVASGTTHGGEPLAAHITPQTEVKLTPNQRKKKSHHLVV
jgi:hypothetical protein